MQQNKVVKPITNPALLKLGGNQPIDRGDDANQEYDLETVALKLPVKHQQANECYSSPIPTRKQIEAEIPVGSARDRIKLFGDAERETSHSPVRNLNKSTKLDDEVDNYESSVSRTRKLFTDVAASDEHKQMPVVSNESSIRRMVRKFSTDDDSNKASQPVWCQKKEGKVSKEEKIVLPMEQKTSTTKSAVKMKSAMKDSKVRRKPG